MEYRYSMDSAERPSDGVIAAMAEQADCSPLELKPLGTAIDPEALDKVLETGTSTSVSFECCGAEFTVTNEEVYIQDPDEETETP